MRKIIFCRLLVGFLCFGLSGCLVDRSLDPPPNYASSSVAYNSYGEVCEEEPYWEEPLWCDWYGGGHMICCVWYVDGWYEEWCQWDTGWCWDYNGSW